MSGRVRQCERSVLPSRWHHCHDDDHVDLGHGHLHVSGDLRCGYAGLPRLEGVRSRVGHDGFYGGGRFRWRPYVRAINDYNSTAEVTAFETVTSQGNNQGTA